MRFNRQPNDKTTLTLKSNTQFKANREELVFAKPYIYYLFKVHYILK